SVHSRVMRRPVTVTSSPFFAVSASASALSPKTVARNHVVAEASSHSPASFLRRFWSGTLMLHSAVPEFANLSSGSPASRPWMVMLFVMLLLLAGDGLGGGRLMGRGRR